MRRSIAAGLMALSIAGASHGSVLARSVIPARGHIVFGLGIDHRTLGILRPRTSVRRGTSLWFSAHLSSPAGPSIRVAVARVLAGTSEQMVAAVSVPIADPRDDMYASRFKTDILAPGHYAVDLTRGSDLLAEGGLAITGR